MRKNIEMLLMGCLLIAAAGFVSGSTVAAGEAGIKKVAVVSLAVNDVAGTVIIGSVGGSVPELIRGTVNHMVDDAEKKLGQKWKVIKAASFINNAGYRNTGVPKTLRVYVPKINGREMPVFTEVGKEIKSGQLNPQKAMTLCKALNVDGVVVIFSEWSSRTGGIVPTTKAVTKNVLTVYDGSGKQVIKKRVDLVGKKTLGARGIKAVNQKTIEEWRDSYNRSLDKIVSSL